MVFVRLTKCLMKKKLYTRYQSEEERKTTMMMMTTTKRGKESMRNFVI